jgi:NAD(P)-dependent dehydrogenase (short-subunit alcohol dehydrogenase family)
MKLTFAPGVALVTGGSGGIGAAVVRALLEEGVAVALTYNAAEAAAGRLVAASPPGARVAAYRWSSPAAADAAALVARASNDLGPVRFLVACAGIAQGGAFYRTEEPEWSAILATNLQANLALARQVVAPMLKAGSGRIVLLSSVSGSRGIEGHTAYAASKGGLDAFARALARECGPFGVTVNTVAPGYVDTPMLARIPEKARAALVRGIPVRRLGTPEEVARVVAFLLSQEAAYVTGQTWAIDGGLSS